MLLDMISKLYITQGTNTMKAITTGSNIVHEKDINWSNRILGKEALTHINTNTIMQALIPMVRPYIIPSIIGEEKNPLVRFSTDKNKDSGSYVKR